MEPKQRMQGISNLFSHWFNFKETKKDSYLAFKALHYNRIYDLITPKNCETPEIAFKTMNQLLGQKVLFMQIKAQYELSCTQKDKNN